MRAQFILRVRVLSALFILMALILAVRLYFVQVVHGGEYRDTAFDQYVGGAAKTFARGDIYFSRANGEETIAATTKQGWKIAIQPNLISDQAAVWDALSAHVSLDRARFDAAAAKLTDPYEEIAFQLSDAEGEAIREIEIKGVLVVRDSWRTYPGTQLAAQALGFVGFNAGGSERTGVYGLERYYDDTLRRESDALAMNPFAELFSNVSAAIASDPRAFEGDIVTSLEPSVQAELERTLSSVNDAHRPVQAGGIVMDPKTGDIVAMAVTPTFDPNAYNTVTNQSVFTNPLVEGRYEMGSIMKPLTVAAGIDAGVISPATTYNDQGYVMKSGKRISNFDGRGRGVVSMQEVLNQSLNTGIAFIVDKLGKAAWGNYIVDLQLGEETGIDLPHEVAGDIAAITDGNADVDFASAGFGQGIAVTPIEMIRALAALANGGVLPEPRVARSVRYPSGVSRSLSSPTALRVYSEETAHTVTTMLAEVFDDALLDGALKQEHYSIAAKTGTAQIASPTCGGYCADRYLHSFFGYFPASDPRFIIFLYAVEPKGEVYASRTLARPFMSLAKFTINHYTIPPDR